MARTVQPEPASDGSDGPPKKRSQSQKDSDERKSSKSSDKKRKGTSTGTSGSSSTKAAKRAKKSSTSKSGGLKANKAYKTEVMTKIPSLKQCDTFQGFPSFKAQLDDNSMVEFKKDQAVFVLPDPDTMETPTDYPDQSQYWIGLVKDIRAKSTLDKETNEWTADPSEVWVIVEWFYKPSDVTPGTTTKAMAETVKNEDEFFGVKELLRSHHKSVISVFSCCEPVPIYEFHDDAGPDHPAVTLLDDPSTAHDDEDDNPAARLDPETYPNQFYAAHANYFYRLSLPKTDKLKKTISKKKNRDADEAATSLAHHCICNQPYSPSIDIMRYCTGCLKWFHRECLTEFSGVPKDAFEAPQDAPEELLQIARYPVVRGGVWGIGGNINIVWAARDFLNKAAEQDTDIEDWEKDMTMAGLEEWRDWQQVMGQRKKNGEPIYVDEAKKRYHCPACEQSI